MNKKQSYLIIVLFFILILACGCAHTDPRLYGRWRSNNELSTEYYENNAKLNDVQMNALTQIFGKMEIEYFNHNKCKIVLPDNIIHTGEKNIEIKGFEDIMKFNIIYRNEDIVVILYDDPLQGEIATILNFVDDDTYWIYLGGNGLIDLNTREYFSRIK